jgi:hypothetical protein
MADASETKKKAVKRIRKGIRRAVSKGVTERDFADGRCVLSRTEKGQAFQKVKTSSLYNTFIISRISEEAGTTRNS